MVERGILPRQRKKGLHGRAKGILEFAGHLEKNQILKKMMGRRSSKGKRGERNVIPLGREKRDLGKEKVCAKGSKGMRDTEESGLLISRECDSKGDMSIIPLRGQMSLLSMVNSVEGEQLGCHNLGVLG